MILHCLLHALHNENVPDIYWYPSPIIVLEILGKLIRLLSTRSDRFSHRWTKLWRVYLPQPPLACHFEVINFESKVYRQGRFHLKEREKTDFFIWDIFPRSSGQ